MPLSCIGCFRCRYNPWLPVSRTCRDFHFWRGVRCFFYEQSVHQPSEVFAPRCDETCRCAVLRSYYCTTARVPYCVCRCSEQCPCLPANGHPRPISRCLAEDYTCPFGLTLTELWRAASGVLYSSVHNSQPQIRVTIRHRPTGTWEHSFLAV